MKLVNISQAKTHLSSLIEAAGQGEEVMILRGSVQERPQKNQKEGQGYSQAERSHQADCERRDA
jgi:hypothetical protein